MKLAVNSFSKGLQTDTHPMIQGTDTLSDCLNGTFVTMLGNEIILQNDMGNRRVNNAFLPPGYQPVGIKEYGGVIYIAAYNPITNKSQIGSFPSPLRKINNEINPNLLGNTFKFGDVLSEANIYNYPLKNIPTEVLFLNNDVFLVPLTTDIVIHAGDKFVVSADKLSENWEYITNYKNTHNLIDGVDNTTKAISPKNRMFTISLGVLNSLNEFVDITKTLCRWEKKGNKWSIKNYNSSYSDIFKFNDEYFIPDTFNNDELDETIEDAKLIRVRQAIEANTYAYKLIGPLYLKVALNHIETFSFNIYGRINKEEEPEPIDSPQSVDPVDPSLDEPQNPSPDEPLEAPGDEGDPGDSNDNEEETDDNEEETEGSASILIEAFITYNCPDGINSSLPGFDLSDLNGNLDYETFDEGIPDPDKFRIFDFIGPDGTVLTPSKRPTYKKSIYNPNNNLYTLRIIKEYDISYTDNQFNYFIGVLVDRDIENEENTDPVYLRGLSTEGTIDLNLLGSGQVSGDIWKFHNTVKKDLEGEVNGIDIKLLFGLSAYPTSGHTYRNLRFKFENINGNDEVYYGPVNTSISVDDPSLPSFLSLLDGQIGINSVIREEYNRSNFRSNNGNFIKPRESYKVFVYCDDYDNEGDTSLTTLLLSDLSLWYLSTELFNEFFSNDIIKNFCTVDTTSDSPINQKFAEKMIVKLDSLVSAGSTGLESTKVLDGSVVSTSSNISFSSNNIESIELEYSTDVKIKNEELYPSAVKKSDESNDELEFNLNDTEVRFENIKLNFSYNDSELNAEYINSIRKNNGDVYTHTDNYEGGNFDNEDLFSVNITNSEQGKISVEINHNDLLLGNATDSILTAIAFDNFFDYIKDNFDELVCYHGLVLNYESGTLWILDAPYKRRDKGDFIEALPPDDKYYSDPNNNNFGYEDNYYPTENGKVPRMAGGNGIILHYNTNLYDENNNNNNIYKIMNNYSPSDEEGKIFSYIFSDYSKDSRLTTCHYKNDNNSVSNLNFKWGYLSARVWWKSYDGDWVLFKNLLEKNNSIISNYIEINDSHLNYDNNDLRLGSVSKEDFITFLSSQMKDYVYCIDTLYNFENLSTPFYSILGTRSSYQYINEHNINMFLVFKFGISNANIIELGQGYGNLLFSFDNTLGCIEEYNVKLKSNNDFYRTIKDLEDMSESELPIYIKTGEIYDNRGYLLNYEYVYYLEENKLKNLNSNKIGRKMLEGNPVLLYNLDSNSLTDDSEEIVYRYDLIGRAVDDIPMLTVDYLEFPIVNNV